MTDITRGQLYSGDRWREGCEANHQEHHVQFMHWLSTGFAREQIPEAFLGPRPGLGEPKALTLLPTSFCLHFAKSWL